MSSFASTIRLLSNVPLDKNHDNTITFPNSDAQQTYFSGKTIHSMFNCSYQREQMTVRVDAEYNRIVNCNYLMYQNQEFSNKWFYAFITQIEYKNDDLSIVHFEIDSYQTFMFDITVHPCYVQREHVNDDAIGKNLIEEGLPLGEYVVNSQVEKWFQEWWIVVGSTLGLDPEITEDYLKPVSGKFYSNVYSGVKYYVYDEADQLSALFKLLDTHGKNDAITTIFMIPKEITKNTVSFTELKIEPAIIFNTTLPVVNSLNGYTPKNNKMLCYPYRVCLMSNTSGGTAELKYEYFSTTPQVGYNASLSQSGRIMAIPKDYKGRQFNYDEGLQIGNFPVCTWTSNVYANWQAQNQVSQSMGWVSAGVGLAASIMTANPIPAALTAINLAQTQFVQTAQHSMIPPQARGNSGGESLLVSNNIYGFIMLALSITSDQAKANDDYMTMYGYRVDKVKVPNITGRPYWNYVKTENAVITGNCPVEHLSGIKQMFNHGVTFWHGDYVGDYTLNNSTGQIPPEPEFNYTLNVIGGSGAGQYKGNTQVNITADEPTKFKNWSSNGGGTFADPNLATTIYTMPFNNVTITANYDTPQPTENLADYAMQFIGAVEWDDTVRLWQTWYYGSYVKDAWCTTFTTYCAYMIGKGSQVPKNAAVQTLYNQMTSKGTTWRATVGGKLPKRGDICFFITSQSSTTLHHCGIVTNMHSDGVTFDYVSGNTGNPTAGKPDGVFVKTTTIGKTTPSYVKYFGEVN